MATILKLKSDIKKLKAAMERKGIDNSLKSKLKTQLEKVENELASMQKGAAPRKVSTTKGTATALSKLQKMVKSKKYSVYQGSRVDLKKDADEGAMAIGRRISKGLKANGASGKGGAKYNKGHVYYEYRPNRLDVKQPKKQQTYPKLADGGYMAKGGEIESFENKVKDALKVNNQWHFITDEIDGKPIYLKMFVGVKEVDVQRFTIGNLGAKMPKNYVGKRETLKMIMENFQDSMAKGGKTIGHAIYFEPMKNLGGKSIQSNEEIRGNYRDMDKVLDKKLGDNYLGSTFYINDGYGKILLENDKDGQVVKSVLKMFDFEDATSQYMAKGGKTKDEPKVIRGYSDDEAYEYANGGHVMSKTHRYDK